jgi:IclR family KDG regulon transcriptional repressor
MVERTAEASPAEESSSYHVQSVLSAFELLFAFLKPPVGNGELGVSELARRCGQTKNQTFRLLQTMIAAGVVIQNPENRTYSLGYRLLELGAAAQAKSNLVHAARSTIDRVPIEAGDRINLGMLSADFATVLIDSRSLAYELPVYQTIGARFALHAGSGSKLLLAFSDPEYFEEYIRVASPLKRFTPYTCVQPSLLRQECAQIREQGYSLSFQDLELNRCSLSVPIRDRHNDVIAGLSMSSHSSRFREEDRHRKLAILRSACDEISKRLGYRKPV